MIAALVLAISAAAVAPPAPVAAERDALARLERVRSACASLEAEGVILMSRGANVAAEEYRFRLDFLSPARFRIEIQAGAVGEVLLLSDGDSVWTAFSGDSVVHREAFTAYRYRRAAEADPLTEFLLDTTLLSTRYALEAPGVGGRPSAEETIRLKPLHPRDFDFLQVRLDETGQKILSIEAYKRSRVSARVRFDRFAPGAELAEERFLFDPGDRSVEEDR